MHSAMAINTSTIIDNCMLPLVQEQRGNIQHLNWKCQSVPYDYRRHYNKTGTQLNI